MRSRKSAALWILVGAYAGLIFFLSSQPVPAAAEGAVVSVGDKSLHGIEYAGLTFLLAFAIASSPWSRLRSLAAVIALAGAIAFAATDELHQTFVPGRVGDVVDFVADSLGELVAAVAFEGWRRWSARRIAVSGTSPR